VRLPHRDHPFTRGSRPSGSAGRPRPCRRRPTNPPFKSLLTSLRALQLHRRPRRDPNPPQQHPAPPHNNTQLSTTTPPPQLHTMGIRGGTRPYRRKSDIAALCWVRIHRRRSTARCRDQVTLQPGILISVAKSHSALRILALSSSRKGPRKGPLTSSGRHPTVAEPQPADGRSRTDRRP
jgi:hypothetical protein